MAKAEKILVRMRESPTNISYSELYLVCCAHFGAPRRKGTSHAVFRMPWPGDPRVNIQRGSDGSAKVYQVKQAVAAIDRLLRLGSEDGD
ncbi:toxin HicA [Nocardia jiangsuensis]|uniref:Toxin HicA n=1 Tax=Nocardia jiangsuensis TaxID=1691563 RepID=A0ABV8DKX8_9NOCA